MGRRVLPAAAAVTATVAALVAVPWMIVVTGQVGVVAAVTSSVVFRVARARLHHRQVTKMSLRGGAVTRFGTVDVTVTRSGTVTGVAPGLITGRSGVVVVGGDVADVTEAAMLRRAECWFVDGEERAVRQVDWVYSLVVYGSTVAVFAVFGAFETALWWAAAVVAHFLAVLSHLTDTEKRVGERLGADEPQTWEALRVWSRQCHDGAAVISPMWFGDLMSKRFVPFPPSGPTVDRRQMLLVGVRHGWVAAQASWRRRGDRRGPSMPPTGEAD